MSMSRKAWLRLGYPRRSWLAVAAIALLTPDLLLLCSVSSMGWRLEASDRFFMSPFLALPMVAGIAWSAILGVYRAWRFPSPKSDLADWLLRTPWDRSQRTPFGPWKPVASDLLVLGGLSVFCLLHAIAESRFAFQGVYPSVAMVSWCAAIVGPWLAFGLAWAARGGAIVWGRWRWDWWVVLLGGGIGANAIAHDVPEVLLVLVPGFAIGLFYTVLRRLYRVLGELPDQAAGRSEVVCMSEAITDGTYSTLSPRPFDRPFDTRNSNLGDLLPVEPKCACAIGSVVFVLLMAFSGAAPSVGWYRYMSMLVVCLMTVPAVVYGAIWAHGTGSHLSVAARWATKRFLVWEYDKVWLIPLLVMPSIAAVVLKLSWPLMPSMYCIPLAVSTGLAVGMMVGPNRQTWWLTAPLKYSRPAKSRRTANSLFVKAK